jgi:hypothetical protein
MHSLWMGSSNAGADGPGHENRAPAASCAHPPPLVVGNPPIQESLAGRLTEVRQGVAHQRKSGGNPLSTWVALF